MSLIKDDPARVAGPDYRDAAQALHDAQLLDRYQSGGIPEGSAIEDSDIDAAIEEADHTTLTDWLTEGCFYPGLPVRHDRGVMAALRKAAVSERDDDALALAKLLVQAIREQVRDGLEAKS